MTAEWVLAVERAYATTRPDAAGAGAIDADAALVARARGAAAAVASRYLAVGTPRSFGLVVDSPAQHATALAALAAHGAWFKPVDVRCVTGALAAAAGGREVTVAEALAADIVCVCAAVRIAPSQLRRGTHVNILGDAPLDMVDAELRAIAQVFDEPTGLPALAAGIIDGRQLDEITVFVAGAAPIAQRALAAIS